MHMCAVCSSGQKPGASTTENAKTPPPTSWELQMVLSLIRNSQIITTTCPALYDACWPSVLSDEHMNRNYFPLSVYFYFNLESPERQRDDLGPDPQSPNKQQPRAQKHTLNYLFSLEHCSLLWKGHMLSYYHAVLSWLIWYPLTPPHPRHHCLHSYGLLLHISLLPYYYFVRCQQMLSPAFHMYCVTEYIEVFHCLKNILRFGWKKRLVVVPCWDLCEDSSETKQLNTGICMGGVKESWVLTWQLFIPFMRFSFCHSPADMQLLTVAYSLAYGRNNSKYN